MYKHGHHDRACCDAHKFDGSGMGRRMRARTLRDSLVYGTRVVRHKGLTVDDSLRLVQYKAHSRPIRDSIVYGTREKRCRHKQCTAWHHFHEFNEEMEKWDFPDQIAANQEKRALWLAARKSVLDQADIRRKSIPKNRYGELETDAGHYAGEFLRALLKPWDYGNHQHDMYRHVRPSFLTDRSVEELSTHYDPRPEAVEFHKAKVHDLKEWQRVEVLTRDMQWELLRVQGIQRCRHHFQHLKDRLQQAKMLWSELNRNSVWFVPWPEGDHVPELVRRSLMMISKRLSTCAPMWNDNFKDLQALDRYLNNLEEMAPKVWERFHYNCKLHKHLDLHNRRTTRLECLRKASLPAEPVAPIQLPLCGPVLALQKRIADLIAALPEHLRPRPRLSVKPIAEAHLIDQYTESKGRSKMNCSPQVLDTEGRPLHAKVASASGGAAALGIILAPNSEDAKPNEIPRSKTDKTKIEKYRSYCLAEIAALSAFDERMEASNPSGSSKRGSKVGEKNQKTIKSKEGSEAKKKN